MMKNNKLKKILVTSGGLLVGVVNGLLGAGGGMLAVPLIKYTGKCQDEAHANSVGLIFCLSLISAAVYLFRGNVEFENFWFIMPAGIAGAVIGAFVLKKIPDKILRKIFALFMLWAGARLLWPK